MKGFTLIEVVVALVLLSVGVLGSQLLLHQTLALGHQTTLRELALTEGLRVFDSIRVLDDPSAGERDFDWGRVGWTRSHGELHLWVEGRDSIRIWEVHR